MDTIYYMSPIEYVNSLYNIRQEHVILILLNDM